MRFEKAQDPENTLRAIARATELFELVCPDMKPVGGVADVRAARQPQPVIVLDLNWLERKLGRAVAKTEVIGILSRLAFEVVDLGAALEVKVPTWRATKDISIPDDLVEEVGRTLGYSTIPPQAPAMPVAPPPVNLERRFHNRLRWAATQQGFHEIYNYSFVSTDQAARLGVPVEAHVRVLNPISVEQSLLRTTLLHGALKNFEDNRKQFDQFRFFEIGKEIHKQPEGLPLESPHLVAGIYAGSGDGAAGLEELRRLAQCFARGVEFRPVAAVRAFEHPQRVAEAVANSVVLGRLFEFHPDWVEGRAAVLDLDLKALEPFANQAIQYSPVRRFPASEFDLSVVAEARAHTGDVLLVLRKAAGVTVESIAYLREFVLPDARRSLSFRITVARRDRTLTQEEINAERAHLIVALEAAGYSLR